MEMPAPKHRRKITTAALVLMSDDAMIGTLNRYVELKLKIAEATAAHDREVAELNSAFDDAVQQEREELAVLESSVQLYCVNNRAKLFSDKKSRDYPNATIGFRLGNYSVGKRVAKDTFEAIALRLDELPWGEPYVEWKPSLKKDVLLRDRAQLSEEQLKAAGIRFEQDEFFFIEPSSQAIERSKKPVEQITAQTA
jgi:phage host-nuclease inhibitor protein Gam